MTYSYKTRFNVLGFLSLEPTGIPKVDDVRIRVLKIHRHSPETTSGITINITTNNEQPNCINTNIK